MFCCKWYEIKLTRVAGSPFFSSFSFLRKTGRSSVIRHRRKRVVLTLVIRVKVSKKTYSDLKQLLSVRDYSNHPWHRSPFKQMRVFVNKKPNISTLVCLIGEKTTISLFPHIPDGIDEGPIHFASPFFTKNLAISIPPLLDFVCFIYRGSEVSFPSSNICPHLIKKRAVHAKQSCLTVSWAMEQRMQVSSWSHSLVQGFVALKFSPYFQTCNVTDTEMWYTDSIQFLFLICASALEDIPQPVSILIYKSL